MQVFGLTESELAMRLSDFVSLRCLNLPPELQEIPYALLGSKRMAPLCDTIKAIAKMASVEDAFLKDLDAVTAHLGEIRFLRDKIAHNGVIHDSFEGPGWFCVDNVHNAGDFEKIRYVSFRIEHLVAATSDLGWAGYRVALALHAPAKRDQFTSGAACGERGKKREWNLNPRSRPWLYKPRELKIERTNWRRKTGQGLAQES